MMAIHFNQNMYLFLNILSIYVLCLNEQMMFCFWYLKYNGDESP